MNLNIKAKISWPREKSMNRVASILKNVFRLTDEQRRRAKRPWRVQRAFARLRMLLRGLSLVKKNNLLIYILKVAIIY